MRDAGIAAEAIPNPLRGLTFDGEYVASVLGQLDGPIVLVGHSYGGAVMTYASSKASNVRALVYVASFGLDQGVSANQLGGRLPATRASASWQSAEPLGSTLLFGVTVLPRASRA